MGILFIFGVERFYLFIILGYGCKVYYQGMGHSRGTECSGVTN